MKRNDIPKKRPNASKKASENTRTSNSPPQGIELTIRNNEEEKPREKSMHDFTDKLFEERYKSLEKGYFKETKKKKTSRHKNKTSHHKKDRKKSNTNTKIALTLSNNKEEMNTQKYNSFLDYLQKTSPHIQIKNKKIPLPIEQAPTEEEKNKQKIKDAQEAEYRKLMRGNIQNSYCDVVNFGPPGTGNIALVDVDITIPKLNENGETEIETETHTHVITVCSDEVSAWNMTDFANDNKRKWTFKKPEEFTNSEAGKYISCSFYTNKLWTTQGKIIFAGYIRNSAGKQIDDQTAIFVVGAKDKNEIHTIIDKTIIPSSIQFEDNCIIYKLNSGQIVTQTLFVDGSKDPQKITFNSESFDPNYGRDCFFLTTSQYIVDILPSEGSSTNILMIDRKTNTTHAYKMNDPIFKAFLCNDFLICDNGWHYSAIDLVSKKPVQPFTEMSKGPISEESEKRKSKQALILKIFSPETKVHPGPHDLSLFEDLFKEAEFLDIQSQGSKTAFALRKIRPGAEYCYAVEIVIVDFETLKGHKLKEVIQFPNKPKELLSKNCHVKLKLKDEYLIVTSHQDKVRELITYTTTEGETRKIEGRPHSENWVYIWDMRTNELLTKSQCDDLRDHLFEKGKLLTHNGRNLTAHDYDVGHHYVNKLHVNSLPFFPGLKPSTSLASLSNHSLFWQRTENSLNQQPKEEENTNLWRPTNSGS